MTEELRAKLRAALKEIHDRVHDLYPKGDIATEPAGQDLRNRLLVVDLAMHLADEIIGTASPDERRVVGRAAKLLYGTRLVAPSPPLGRAAGVLLTASPMRVA